VLIDCTGSLVIAILFFLIPPTERWKTSSSQPSESHLCINMN
jgi:hypothetical protein